jgi:apolipoprotein N-acyltransferase
VLLCNILIYHTIKEKSRRRAVVAALAVVLPLAVSLIMYSSWKESGRSATVTVVQPNIEPWTEKFVMSQAEQTAILLDLIHEAPRDADFIVTPETAINDDLWEESLMNNNTIQKLSEIARTTYPNSLFIIGANTYKLYLSNPSPTARTYNTVDYWWDSYNSALALDASHIGIYRKNKLVAGAEMIPYYSLLKNVRLFSIDLGGEMGQLGYGNTWDVFTSPRGIRSSVGICYESAYGEYMAKFVSEGAEILKIITNDGWWGDTPGYRQHFSFSRLRAIETRRSIARSANTGISGFINPRGDVISKLGWDIRGTLTESVPLEDKITFYVRTGDYLGRISGPLFMLSLLCLVAFLVSKRKITR